MKDEIRTEEFLGPEKRAYTGLESVLSWLCLLAGYIFCRLFPAGENPLGAACFLWVLYILAFVVIRLKKLPLAGLPVAAAGSGLLAAIIPPISGNRFLSLFAFAYALATLGYFIYAAGGNCLKKGFATMIFMDFFKALAITPFLAMGDFFRAMFSGKFGRKISLRVLIGVFAAILPTALVFGLLSYDSSFTQLWSDLFDFDLLPHLGSLILGIPLGMYLFGLFQSSFDRRPGDFFTAEECEKASAAVKIAPTVTVLAATIPLLFIYIVFFISQWKYYISGFTGVLPNGFSYANYAREGFFQLCSVAVINLIVTAAVILFMRRHEKGSRAVQRVICILFSVFTLVLIATALAKMGMYIQNYGLTQKRVYASWLMGVLALVFILIPVGQFVSKLQVGALALAITVAAFSVLGLCNADGFIAKYNVEHYLSGELTSLDLNTLYELGDPAVPQLVRLAEGLVEDPALSEMNAQLYSKLNDRLQAKYRCLPDDRSIFSVSIPSLRAEKALRERYGTGE